MHYLDNAATTRVLPEAAEAAVHAMLEEFGNPSSLHRMGLEASYLLEDSRKTVASALGCLPEEVYFTACGTESTNISLHGAAHLNRHKKGRIIVTEIEHAATINTAKQLADSGFDVVFLAPDATGHITPEALAEIGRPLASSKSSGLGLGLMISKSIAEAHLATLAFSARTARDGGGLAVTLTMPARSEAPLHENYGNLP